MMRKLLSVLLVLCLLPVCSLAETNSEYIAELQLLNEYMRTMGEDAPEGIEEICDQIEGNGRIGEYTVEFGIYANVLRLLETGDYSAALSEAGDLLNSVSFEKFREYLEDGEELRAWGLYALDSVERLYSYVQGRASEAQGEWKKAAQYYSACEQFMDARERKQFANQVTPPPTSTPTPTSPPTPTPTPIRAPKLTTGGMYRLFPEIKSGISIDDGKRILKNQYGFDDVEFVDSGWTRLELDEGEYLGIPTSGGYIEWSAGSSGGLVFEDILYLGDGNEEVYFNTTLEALNQTIGKPDFGVIELYEFGLSEFREGEGRHELCHLTTDELRSGTISSIIGSSRVPSAKSVEIEIYWDNLQLYFSYDSYGDFQSIHSWLTTRDYVMEDYYEDVLEEKYWSSDLEDYLPADWKNNNIAVARNVDNETDSVKRIQRALNAAGYNVGSVDGSFGRKSEEAISKWQKDHMISGSSGICTPLTAIRLLSDKAEGYRGAAVTGHSMPVIEDKTASYTESSDGGIDVIVHIKNTSDCPVVAICVQSCVLNKNGKNVVDSGDFWYATRARFLKEDDTIALTWGFRFDEVKNAKSLAVRIAEVQFADGTIISDFMVNDRDLLKSGTTVTLDLEPA